MGNSSSASTTKPKAKVPHEPYTFGKKANLNPLDYILSKKNNEQIYKTNGSIGGQQFIIEVRVLLSN